MAVSAFIPEVWAAQILANLREEGTVSETVNREYEGEARKGNVVHITSFNEPALIDLTTTGRVATPTDLVDSSQALLINQEKAFAFYVGDIDKAQAAGPMDAVARDAASALRKDLESYVFAQMQAGGTNIDPAGTRTFTTAAEAYALFLETREAFTDAEVPVGDRWCAVNGAMASLLLAESSKLTSADIAGDSRGLRDAALGKILSFTTYETSLFGTAGTPAAVFYHRPSVGLVHQISETEAVRATDRFADVVRGLSVYGAKVLRPAAVRWVV